MKKLVVCCALSLALLCTVGCIHKSSGTVSPWERIMTDNALLAQFTDSAEQGTELAVTSGLMSTAQARPVILFESQFADAHKKITAILAAGPSAADLTQVNALLTALKTQGVALVASGDIGVKNPKTAQTITGDINNIVAMVQAVLSDVQLFKSGGSH